MRKHGVATLVAAALALTAILTACHESSDENFPEYALPQNTANAPGSAGSGVIVVNSGAMHADVWSVATDEDLGPQRDRIRAALLAHGWTVEDATDSAVGVGWYRTVSPDGQTCMRYLTVDADNVPWTNNDPLLSVYSYADWIDRLGDYHLVLMIVSQPCPIPTQAPAPND